VNTLQIKISRIFFFFSLFFLLFFITSQRISAQTLPSRVTNYLDKSYLGWKQTAVAKGCYASFKKSVIVGDFDSNGKRDYAVKFIKGRKGYILAFLAKGSDYKPYLLASYTASEIKSEGLSIGRKGERIENEEGDVYYLKDDSPLIGPCESDAGGFLSFRNGDFKPL
jgi:hypothetical protein